MSTRRHRGESIASTIGAACVLHRGVTLETSEPPFGELLYLYLGSADLDADVAFYRNTLAAPMVWRFEKFGTEVAAFRVGAGPLVLLAAHRPAPSCIPIFGVPDLEAAGCTLRARGWTPTAGPFEIPDGPCFLFHDPSKNPLAILEARRPRALEHAWAARDGDPVTPSGR